MADTRVLPAVQDRSNRTARRLLHAAELVLSEHGYEGATIPRIAKRAGVAVGTVYWRFADKDALLRELYLDFFARARASNREAVAALAGRALPLADLVPVIVGAMVAGYRRSPRLLAALGTFARTHGDARFRREARRVNDEAFDVLRELLLSERALIARPAPEKAVSFAFLAATSVLRSVVYGEAHGGSPMTLDDPDLVAEMTALMLGYLSPGARRRAAGGRTKPRPERPSRSR